MVRTIKDQIKEKKHWKKVDLVRNSFSFNDEDIKLVGNYEETINRLELIATETDKMISENLESISIYTDGIFVYEEDVKTNSFIDALPRQFHNVSIIEIVINGKLAILASRKKIIFNILNKKVHENLIKQLERSFIWQLITNIKD